MRMFLAADISEDIRDALDRFMQPLRAEREVKWVAPANLHITLYFLGHLPDEQLGEVHRIASGSVGGIRPFSVSIRGISGFPNPGRPRVIWAGVDDGGMLERVYSAILEGLRGSTLDVKIEKRPYTPHVTLGRVKNRCPAYLPGTLEKDAGREFGSCTVDRIVLYRSTLTRSGAVYDQVEYFVFG